MIQEFSFRAASCAAALLVFVTASGGWTQQLQDKGTAVEMALPRVYDLNLAIETALRKYPAVATAEARSQAAKSGISAAGATYRPYVTANVGVDHTLAGDKTVVIPSEGSATQALSTEPLYTTALNLITPIIREGGLSFTTLPSENVARATYDNVWYNEQVLRKDLVSTVTTAFFTVLLRKEAVKVNQQQVALNQHLVENARHKFAQEFIPKADVLLAESALATAEADLAVARVDLSTGLRDFAANIGLDPLSNIVEELELLDKGESAPPVERLDHLLKDARTRHPLALAQEAILKQATAALDVIKSERYPTLDSTFTLGTVDNFSFPVNSWSFRANLRMTWKLFDFGSLNSRIKQQTETMEAEKRALEQVRFDVTKAVVAAYGAVLNLQSKLPSAKKALDLQEELVRAARERFGQNLVPLSELLQAEAVRATAQRTLIETQYNLKIEYAKLIAAAGGQ